LSRFPVLVHELLEPFGADRRFEVLELKVGEVAGELVQGASYLR
jgi:hypothetical protein